MTHGVKTHGVKISTESKGSTESKSTESGSTISRGGWRGRPTKDMRCISTVSASAVDYLANDDYLTHSGESFSGLLDRLRISLANTVEIHDVVGVFEAAVLVEAEDASVNPVEDDASVNPEEEVDEDGYVIFTIVTRKRRASLMIGG